MAPVTAPAHPPDPRRRRFALLRTVAVLAALAAAALFLARWSAAHRELLSDVAARARWDLVALASLLWFVTFATLVVGWGRSMRWWGARLADFAALRMFFLANVARYIPGAVWQFAGIEAMAGARGVPPLAATTGLLIQQVVLLATGLLWSAALVPGALAGSGGAGGATLLAIGLAAGLAVATFAAPRLVPLVGRIAEKRLGRAVVLPTPPPRELALFSIVHAAGWIGYGLAFWLFGVAVLGAEAPSLALALGAYISSYVVGILAVFAPGGLVVRETALVAALGPAIGVDRALLLAVASRLWLVAMELVGAAVLAPFGGDA